jgi:outer membrane protein W
MKKKILIVLSLVTMFLFSGNLYAQESSSRAGFQVGGYLPLGDWSDWVSAGIGGSALYNYKITGRIALTGAIGYYNFPSKDDVGDAVGSMGNWSYTVIPILAGLKVGFGPTDQAFQPYIGLELGFFMPSAEYEYKTENGTHTVDAKAETQFGFAPAVGFKFRMGLDVDLDINAKWNIVSDLSHLGINVGIMFRI